MRIAATILVFAVVCAGAHASDGVGGENSPRLGTAARGDGDEIIGLSRKISNAGPTQDAYLLVDRLVDIVAARPTKVSATEMDSIAELLHHPSLYVKSWAAGALGLLGPRGKRILPKLQAAFDAERKLDEQRDPLGLPFSPSVAMCVAINKILSRPRSRRCATPR